MTLKTIRIEGLAELQEALRELPKATGKNVLKRTLRKSLEPMRAQAEQSAPRASGQLGDSINIGTKLSRRQKMQHRKESAVEVFMGPGPLPQAITQEFGTAFHGPKPFMRPAWDGNKMSAFDTIKDDLAGEIEKARERLARKALRVAAKLKA